MIAGAEARVKGCHAEPARHERARDRTRVEWRTRGHGLRSTESMSAYVIANVTVKDPVRYEDYRRLVSPTLARFGGRFIARGGQVEVLEGEWHGTRLVLLEFPSIEAARNWWSSPEYAEAKLIRQATSEGTLLILEGV